MIRTNDLKSLQNSLNRLSDFDTLDTQAGRSQAGTDSWKPRSSLPRDPVRRAV